MESGALLQILDEIKLSQCGWEGNEDVVTFNGEPIGATITKHRREFDRWWPDLKEHIAEYVAKRTQDLAPASNKAVSEWNEDILDKVAEKNFKDEQNNEVRKTPLG